MTPQTLKLVVFLVVDAVLLLGCLYLGYRLGTDLNQAKHDAAVVAKQAGEAAALKAAAEAIAKIEVKSETHIQPVRTEIRTNTVYRDCQHSPDSLRHLNSLIAGEDAAGGGVPASGAAR